MELRKGDRITITGKAGTVTGEVLDIRHLDELPTIPGAFGPAQIAEVRTILREAGVELIAMLGVEDACFLATLDREGNWRDLKGQSLTLTTLPPTTKPYT